MTDRPIPPDPPAEPAGRDRIFAQPLDAIGDFRFDQSVVDVFPDMLDRSIPGYRSIITQTGLLAARYARPGSRLYDLGCSLGATSLAMRAALDQAPVTRDTAQTHPQSRTVPGCEIHAIDNSPAMIERCAALLDESDSRTGPQPDNGPVTPIRLHCEDLQQAALTNASVVAMNFTLQFVPPEARAALMDRISAALAGGGALIISEKLAFDDPAEAQLHTDLYHAFKRANGYSDLEISQKRTALEAVMIPDTLDVHRQRLAAAGFDRISLWFQCFNFASIVALRN